MVYCISNFACPILNTTCSDSCICLNCSTHITVTIHIAPAVRQAKEKEDRYLRRQQRRAELEQKRREKTVPESIGMLISCL